MLVAGTERDDVVRATFHQHPFPGNLFYRLAASHVFADGVYFRTRSHRSLKAGRKRKTPGGGTPGLSLSICGLVAGVGFEPTTFGL